MTLNLDSTSTKNLFSYVANGIPLLSEIEFPELLTTNLKPEITIKFGKVPIKIQQPIYEGPASQAGNNEYLLQIKNVATYYLKKIDNHFTILIDSKTNIEYSEIRVFILSSMLGAICHMKGYLPLHSSGIVYNKKAVLFCGKSGVGKSTICASLYQKGYPFITDNLAAINIDKEGKLKVHPSYSHFRLWQDSLSNLNSFDSNGVKMREGIEKLNLLLKKNLQREPVPLGKIYHLNTHLSDDKIKIENVLGRDKADIIVKETFRIKLLRALGNQKQFFTIMNNISTNYRVAKVYRPAKSFQLKKLRKAILEDCDENLI